MTSQIVIEKAKKHQISLTALLTSLGILAATYLTIGSRLDALISQSPCIKKLEATVELNEKLQNQTNGFVSEKLNKMDDKLDRLLRK